MQRRIMKNVKASSLREKEKQTKDRSSVVLRDARTGHFVAEKAAREIVKRYGEAMKSLSAK